MSVKRFPADTDLPFNKTLYATASTDVVSDADVNATITTDGIAVDLNTGDLAVLADRCQLKVYNGSKWRDVDGGLQGQHTVADNVAKALFTVDVSTTLTAIGGILEYVAVIHNGTAVQLEVGSVPFGALNEAGTVTAVIKAAATDVAADVAGGTNVVAFSASVASTVATFAITCNTSLTITAAHVKWRVRPIGGAGSSATYAMAAA